MGVYEKILRKLDVLEEKVDETNWRLWYVQRRQVLMTKRLRNLQRLEVLEMATWTQVLDSVTRQETVTAGVLDFIVALKAELEEIKGRATGPTAEELQVVVDRLEADADKAAAAIVVNTDAEGEDEVPPLVIDEPAPPVE